VRTLIYVRQSFGQNGTEAELLRKAVENRGDTIIACFADDPSILGKGKNAGWRAMVTHLEQADQIVVGCVADLPGKIVADLFKILATLRDHHVGLFLHQECINLEDGAAAILDLIGVYRAAKLSRAIRDGQAKALAQGRKTGRPAVPPLIQAQIRAALAGGAGVRPTARRYAVSPASVVNIRRAMLEPLALAA